MADVRRALCTYLRVSIEHLPLLFEQFWKYRLMLYFVRNWNASRPNNKSRGKTIEPNIMSNVELGKIIKKIDIILGDIAKTFQGMVEYEGMNHSIKWIGPHEDDTQSRIQASTAAKPIHLLTILPSNEKNNERRGLSKSLQEQLMRLELVIWKITGTPLEILGDDIKTNDILGWEIRSAQDIRQILARNQSLHDGYRVREVSKGIYPRCKVHKVALQPGGWLRGIVRLELYYRVPSGDIENHIGTGWLAGKSMVMTAGHIAYSQEYGMLLAVEVSVAYDLGSPLKRRGTHISVHRGWYTSFQDQYDIACIRLSDPFTEESPMPLCVSAWHNRKSMSVAGYSEDKNNGERMYYASRPLEWYDSRPYHLLLHDMDTEGGNSGSPICDEEFRVICVHIGAQYSRKHSGGVMNHGVIINRSVLQEFSTFLAQMASKNTAGSFIVWRRDNNMGLYAFGRTNLWE